MPIRARDNFFSTHRYIGMEVNLDTYPRPVDFPIGENRMSAIYNYDLISLDLSAITFQIVINYNIVSPTHGFIKCKYELFRLAPNKYERRITAKNNNRELVRASYFRAEDLGSVSIKGALGDEYLVVGGRPSIIKTTCEDVNIFVRDSSEVNLIISKPHSTILHGVEYETVFVERAELDETLRHMIDREEILDVLLEESKQKKCIKYKQSASHVFLEIVV